MQNFRFVVLWQLCDQFGGFLKIKQRFIFLAHVSRCCLNVSSQHSFFLPKLKPLQTSLLCFQLEIRIVLPNHNGDYSTIVCVFIRPNDISPKTNVFAFASHNLTKLSRQLQPHLHKVFCFSFCSYPKIYSRDTEPVSKILSFVQFQHLHILMLFMFAYDSQNREMWDLEANVNCTQVCHEPVCGSPQKSSIFLLCLVWCFQIVRLYIVFLTVGNKFVSLHPPKYAQKYIPSIQISA